jgi:hypothetical protein
LAEDTGTVRNLEDLLERLAGAGDEAGSICIQVILESLGTRSFGSLFLFAALPPLTPVSTIPGVPSTVGIITILTALQLLMGRPSIWLPQVILRHSIDRARLGKALSSLQPVARRIDKLLRPSLPMMTRRSATCVIGLCCLLLGIMMLPLEIVPFTSGIPAFPVALFGLALISRDGRVAIAGFIAAVLAVAVVVAILFFGITTIRELFA